MTALLPILRMIWPYLLAASVGFAGAWYIQGLRVESAKNEFEAYKVEQQRLLNEANLAAEKRRKESSDEYRKNLGKLKEDGEAFKRCVAAGKCGGLLQHVPSCPGSKVPTSIGTNGTSTNAVPSAGESAPQVIEDCAITTLQLNQLQADIEKQ